MKYSQQEQEKCFTVCETYKQYLNQAKTERECVSLIVSQAKEKGFIDLQEYIHGKKIKPQDKIVVNFMNKCVALFQVGNQPLENGLNILGAHIDSPRLDIKQNPLYEKEGFAYLDTHYYGGIKKYQWVATPLALHGVIVKKDGSIISISIGEKSEDPVFVISDLLPHLASNQLNKTANVVIEGENLDVIIGNEVNKECENALKENILKILLEQYDITEEDFVSAELEIVPAQKARDLGLDRSMIIGYGQDDRVCAFTSAMAMLEQEESDRWSCCLLVDKEEIGSTGATGMHSLFFENIIAELMALTQGESYLKVRRALQNSKMLSSDVSAGYDPMFADVFEARNTAFLSKGITINKYTGARGKSGCNDANAEYLAKLRQLFDEAHVSYQFAELGKVDAGGGGTIAYIMANYGMEVIDCGVAVLNMHAPYEVTNKADVYEAYKAYKAFLNWK
ncbi:aminopeptidase [Floccifex sp.]|uniref:aminopeptidase n=1 Tax=Floccifex sp. TaxID=2815810 RepID=UPI003F05DFFD